MDNKTLWYKNLITEEDQKRVKEAVAKAEKLSSAEIVPVLVRRSLPGFSDIIVALLVSSLLAFFIGLLEWYFFPRDWDLGFPLIVGLAQALFLALIVLFKVEPASLRLFVPFSIRHYFAAQRAELEFWRLELYKTRAQTGVLVFVSLEDRVSIVLADSLVDQKIPSSTYSSFLRKMITDIKSKGLPEAYENMILSLSELLKESFPVESDDTNELNNHWIIKE